MSHKRRLGPLAANAAANAEVARPEPSGSRVSIMPMKVMLPDDSALELPEGATGADLAAAIGPGLAKAALAVRVGRQNAAICRRRWPTGSGSSSSPIAARTRSS